MANKYDIPLNAVVNKDLLEHIFPEYGGYIINLQDSDAGGGTHWVAIALMANKDDGNKHCVYWDSFGIDPPTAVMRFCKRWANKMIISEDHIQNINSGYCGQYCILFLEYMFNKFKKHKPMTEIEFSREKLNKLQDLFNPVE